MPGTTGCKTKPRNQLATAWGSYIARIAELERKVSAPNSAKFHLLAFSERLIEKLDLMQAASTDGQQIIAQGPNGFVMIFDRQVAALG